MPSFNPLNENDARGLRAEIASSALALSQGSVPLLEGVRKLASLSFGGENRNDDPDFTLFVAINSETDHLPSESTRSLCAAAWLNQCDRELAEVERVYGSSVKAACERLVARYGTNI